MNFHINEIISNQVNQIIAERYNAYDNVSVLDVNQTSDGYEISGKVDVMGKEYTCEFTTDIQDKIKTYKCECVYCNEKSPCAHIGALMLKINELDIHQYPLHYEKNVRQAVLDEKIQAKQRYSQYYLQEMTKNGRNLITRYKKNYENRIDEAIQQQNIEIEAVLNQDYSQILSVSFRVGKEKKYVIANLSDFLRRIENHHFHRYGKQFETIHRIESFDDFAQAQIQFIKESEQELQNQDLYSTVNMKKTIDLRSSNIDRFYDLYQENGGLNFCCENRDEKIRLQWIDHEKHIEIKLIHNLDGYSCGKKHLFTIKNDKNHFEIQRITLDENGQAIQLIREMARQPICILKEETDDFLKYVLEDVLAYFDIENLPELHKNLEKIKVYGDVNEEGNVLIRVEYMYDDHSYMIGFQEDHGLNYEQDLVEKYILRFASQVIDHEAVLNGNEDRTLDFIEEGFVFLQKYADVYVSESLKHFNERKNYQIHVGVRYESDLLSLDVESDDIPKAEISEILSQYRKKKKFYRLKSGELIHLDAPSIQELSELMDMVHVDTRELAKGKIELNPYRMFTIEEEANSSKNILFERKQSFLKELERFTTLSLRQQTIPDQYESILRDYQKEGVKWLKLLKEYHFNGILADDMGLGKTLQVIALIEDKKSDLPSIVIAPSSLVYNWQDEVEKFSKRLRAVCVVGNQQARKELMHEKCDLLITSYDYLKRDIDEYAQIEFEYVIIDEAQYIKNQKTQNAASVKKLKSRHRLALTGTPIENSLAELWSIFDFLMPGYLFNYHYFLTHFETAIVKNDDEKKKEKLKKLVEPFILRRTKKEVLKELPDKIEKVQLIDFNEEEKKLYYAHLAQVNQELNAMMGNETLNKVEILVMMTRLRQICCEPRLIFDNIDKVSSKMKACLDLILTLSENHQKVLVFSSFTSVLDLLENELDHMNISSYKLVGKTSKENRKEMVDRFQNDDTSVFLISLKAGGTGLNLTAAQAVIHYDPWWNVSAQNQATDRAYRIGQMNHVLVYDLVMKNSIEQKILKLQEKKKNLADSFVENSEGSIAKMDKKDLMDLFKVE